MLKEPLKIILRRFRDRTLESGLLILAVALGIGAFTSGISLIMNTLEFSREVMGSPEYRELIVSTRSESSEMEVPLKAKLVEETAVLTSSDLEAAALAPHVAWAYVQDRDRLHLITSDSQAWGPPEGGDPPPREESSGEASEDEDQPPPPETPAPNRLSRITDDEIAAAAADETILLSDLDEISGYKVTPGFFASWNISAAAGSLFTEADMAGTGNLIVLGADLAEILAGEDGETSALLGKKLLARQGYQTIIGILEPFKESYDMNYFTPYEDRTGGMTQFRRLFMNTQLRFAVDDPENLDSTAVLLKEWFTTQFGEGQIEISNPRAEAERLVARNRGIGILIFFLAAAGFFIALVNVSNILMSRVLRMKKNVGILMALGATKRGISHLFLAEAALLALSGGIAGAVMAVPLSRYMEAAADIGGGSWLYILGGALLSGVLTCLFGLLPSRQFMKIDPAQAMRSAS